jgi:hypothetical protein
MEFDQNLGGRVDEVGSIASALAVAIGTSARSPRFSLRSLSLAYRDALDQRGLMKDYSMRLRRSEVDSELSPFFARLAEYRDYKGLRSDRGNAVSLVRAVISIPRAQTNPLWHIPLIAWAFGGWSKFKKACSVAAR